jgi:hypothetical protein
MKYVIKNNITKKALVQTAFRLQIGFVTSYIQTFFVNCMQYNERIKSSANSRVSIPSALLKVPLLK